METSVPTKVIIYRKLPQKQHRCGVMDITKIFPPLQERSLEYLVMCKYRPDPLLDTHFFCLISITKAKKEPPKSTSNAKLVLHPSACDYITISKSQSSQQSLPREYSILDKGSLITTIAANKAILGTC
ncbi:hypothetical protein ACMFMF_001447 [Clarireedia jacksonii]